MQWQRVTGTALIIPSNFDDAKELCSAQAHTERTHYDQIHLRNFAHRKRARQWAMW